MDRTEPIRRALVHGVHSQVKSEDEVAERQRLEAQYGQVWDTSQLSADFEVLGFAAPYVVVRQKSTGKKGSLMFQHHPRFYFAFTPD